MYHRTHRFAKSGSAVEPDRSAGRPSGVLMGSLRIAVSASLLAASLTTLLAACGHQRPAAGAHPSQSVGGTGRVDTGLAYVTSTTGAVPEAHAVLRNEGQLAAFARRFGKRGEAILAEAGKNDFGRNALVGWSATTGCAKWPSATLHRPGGGDRLTLVAAAHPTPPPECFAPFHIVAVFTVPKDRLPARPRFVAP
ncbi:hypothetical protein ACFZCY_28925 [Streptomyces sp. NPDC007983]|uniref:hypothetical protein n=1 Tax=Streptomyces sp. NPDC007983 TaxID=3364800 RepID=UPI0036EFBD51